MTEDAPTRKQAQTHFLDGKKLVLARRAARMTQEQLAEALPGTDQPRISRYENGTEGCGAEAIALLAVALGCRAEGLMHTEGIRRYRALRQALKAA